MSWGYELWDQFDNLSLHTQRGIEFCEKAVHFYKERCYIENEYASKLKKLVKSYIPKKKDEEEFTCNKGFLNSIQEVFDYAGQHETIAENITNTVIRDLSSLVKELKDERKKFLQDASKQQSVLNSQLDRLEKSKRQYEKMFREAEKAAEAYKNAESNPNLAKIDIDKAKQQMNTRQQQSEDSKSEYAVEVQKSKAVQSEHYENLMPQIFQHIQEMEEKRVAKVRELITVVSGFERSTLPIISKCVDGMDIAATLIDAKKDSDLVIEKYKTGFPTPNDIPFEDLSNGNGNKVVTNQTSTRSGTVSGKGKKRPGLLGIFGQKEEAKDDFSHLPPIQRKKQLTTKIDSIRSNLTKETAERDGITRLRDVYKTNSNLGDPATLNKQLEESAQKIDKLQQELQKYETYLAEADGQRDGHSPNPSPNVGRREPISSSTKPLSQGIETPTTANVAPVSESNRMSRQRSTSDADTSFAHNDSFSDDDDLATCEAMYDYAGDASSLTMYTGETFSVLSKDEGDGWTKVKRTNGEVGYVPTSYIQIH